jgi:hypothetical protein
MPPRAAFVTLPALIGLGVLFAAGCEPKRSADGQRASASPSSLAAPSASAVAKSPFPPEARRDSPPKAIAESALALGRVAPPLAGLPSTAGTWSRASKVTALVFYRGHW